MNSSLTMNTKFKVSDGLTIDLPSISIGIMRSKNICGPPRERVTCEKYFRQAIYIFNEEGKYVDSGFVQINDYTNMCKMIKVCNKSKKIFHLYERWEHYSTKYYKTDNFSITDFVTGNIIGILGARYVSDFTRDNKSCFVGDLEKDEYSEMLLECLNEYSRVNSPFTKKSEDKMCCCNLLEELDINESFKNSEINEEQKQTIFNKLICNCKNISPKPKLTEEKIKRAGLKLQAQSEIAQVFRNLKLEKASEVEETEL